MKNAREVSKGTWYTVLYEQRMSRIDARQVKVKGERETVRVRVCPALFEPFRCCENLVRVEPQE